MFTHDPLAPLARERMDEWRRQAEQARMRRAAVRAGRPAAPRPAPPRHVGWLRRFCRRLLRAAPAPRAS